jgi:hypothetical protein
MVHRFRRHRTVNKKRTYCKVADFENTSGGFPPVPTTPVLAGTGHSQIQNRPIVLLELGQAQLPPVPPAQGKVKLMAGERELTTGLLSKEASFRLVVSGQIGVKEIERLIRKLELDKEILAEQECDETLTQAP